MLRQQIQARQNVQKNAIQLENEELKVIPLEPVKSFESKLDNNSFDPCKFSPPNDFMNKLMIRMNSYERNSPTLTKK
jgi:hypothetical protein